MIEGKFFAIISNGGMAKKRETSIGGAHIRTNSKISRFRFSKKSKNFFFMQFYAVNIHISPPRKHQRGAAYAAPSLLKTGKCMTNT